MRRRLNVVDLDCTLIDLDSARLYIRRYLDAGLLAATAGRIVRVYSAREYAARITAHVTRNFSAAPKRLQRFLDELEQHLDPFILEQMRIHGVGESKTVVLSASPTLYVQEFADRLGVHGIGSYVDGAGRFVHCKGVSKLAELRKSYAPESYEYFFAVGDSDSDVTLLREFEHGYLYRTSTRHLEEVK